MCYNASLAELLMVATGNSALKSTYSSSVLVLNHEDLKCG